MNKLYIKVIDGVIIDHPMLFESVKYLYPEFDGINLPEEIKEFTRKPIPRNIYPFQKAECYYEFDGNMVVDVWVIKDKTEEEKLDVIKGYGELKEGEFIDSFTGIITSLNINEDAIVITR
jgi:hypothetical protein